MTFRRWAGIIIHGALGLVFPYVFIGSILLIQGFMTPSTTEQKIKGYLLAFIYIGLIAVTNIWVLRRLSRKSRAFSILMHVLAFVLAAALMFFYIRL